jgi:hypothetical protein
MAKKSQLETKQKNIWKKIRGRGGGKNRIRGKKSSKKYIRANMPAALSKVRVKKLKGTNLAWKNKGSNLPTALERLRVKKGKEAIGKKITKNRIGRGRQQNIERGYFNYCLFIYTRENNSQSKRVICIRERKILGAKKFLKILSNFLKVAKTSNYEKHA